MSSTRGYLRDFKNASLLLSKNVLVPIRIKMNTIYMFIYFYFYFLVLIHKVLNDLMFCTNMIQECAKWAGNIMAINFYNFSMRVGIRSINKYFIFKMSLQDCLQMPSIHH